jgi:hypothetical protein
MKPAGLIGEHGDPLHMTAHSHVWVLGRIPWLIVPEHRQPEIDRGMTLVFSKAAVQLFEGIRPDLGDELTTHPCPTDG